MNLYIEDSHGKRELIGRPSNDTACITMIESYCERNEYHIPYVNAWITPNLEKHYDVAAGDEHFVVTLW